MVDYQGLLQAGSPVRPAGGENHSSRLIGSGAWRRLLILVALAAIWEITARIVGSPLLLPSFLTTVAATNPSGGTPWAAKNITGTVVSRSSSMTLGLVRPTYAATTSFSVARPVGATTSVRAVRGTDWPT